MTRPWTESVTTQLLATAICPRCRSANLADGACRTCGADLRGPEGAEVWEASLAAAEALRRREEAIDRLPTLSRAAAPAAAAPLGAPSAPTPATPVGAAPERPSSQVSVQSVLAAAGAGLFAVAAIVFTFFNPDLTDVPTRTVIVAAVTALFLGGSWLLARRGLQFSAESIGALGVVFVGLDVWSLADVAPPPIGGFLAGAIGTVIASAGLLWLARRSRIRVWLWSATIGFTIAPALLGYGLHSDWLAAAGEVAALAAALGMLALLPGWGGPSPRRSPPSASRSRSCRSWRSRSSPPVCRSCLRRTRRRTAWAGRPCSPPWVSLDSSPPVTLPGRSGASPRARSSWRPRPSSPSRPPCKIPSGTSRWSRWPPPWRARPCCSSDGSARSRRQRSAPALRRSRSSARCRRSPWPWVSS
ncbi:hypothetical protein [Naasia aerilata]|uniref:Uncharacterized protein n=1 Tax=Naasia aerilata TaxID=1162966 RepID=A0ABM8GGF5_9MICO|nr:hypothetical protein GCM10025866_33550 [Naasia aerilata]